MSDYLINGEGKILGRIGSQIAKRLIEGDKVVILNAEKMVISGHEPDIYAKYKQLVELTDKANPEHAPYWSRRPDLFVKRSIRGMLPYKKPKGKTAFKNLMVYIGVPEQFKEKKFKDIKSKETGQMYENLVTVQKLTTMLGYTTK
jgi:large subunit ribosomal protein L13